MVEGVTSVSVRSCLRALRPDDIARLTFDGLEELVVPERLQEMRHRLRTVVAVAQQETERLASMFDVFRLLTDEVREIASECRSRALLLPQAAALADEKLTERFKESLRVSLAVLCRADGDRAAREVRFLPQGALTVLALDEVTLVSPQLDPLPAAREELPFWNVRAVRPPAPPVAPLAATPVGTVDALVARPGGPRTAAELELLRLWFSPDPPRTLLDRALRSTGAAGVASPPSVRAVFYAGEIADPGILVEADAAHELLGAAAREARAYLEAYESTVVQMGGTLLAVAFERPPFRTGGEEPLLSAGRFALEVARGAAEHGIQLRAAACSGEGSVYEDVNGRPAVASEAAARAAQLLAELPALSQRRAAFALSGASDLLTALLGPRLAGWDRAADRPFGATVWIRSA